MNNTKIKLLEKKMDFRSSSSFSLFKESLECFLLKKEYTECFPPLYEAGMGPEAVADAFSSIVMFHPSDAASILGKASDFSYKECIESFKDYAVDYKDYYKRRLCKYVEGE